MSNFYQNIKKKAFTLAELLIALAIIGILTAILIPIVSDLLPDQNALMAKKAFYTTQTVISSLLNDSACYPKTRSRVGLDDGLGYVKCKKWGGEENTGARSQENYSKKLTKLFADKLDVEVAYNDNTVVQTKDGMVWTWNFTNSSLRKNDPDSSVYLTVDVNGDEEGPNCGQVAVSGICSDSRDKGFDRFTMRIYARGKINILDGWAVEAVRVDKKLVGQEKAINCHEVVGYGGGRENECE